MPIVLRDGAFFGTLCAVDPVPHGITRQQVELLIVLARIVATEIERDREATARAHAEAELENARQAFLAELAHDLKNPLSILHGGAQLLQSRVKRGQPLAPDWLAARLDHIVRAASRAVALLDEQLDIAKMRAGQPLELDRTAQDLGQIVRRVVEEHRTVVGAGRLRLDGDTSPMIAEVDAHRIVRLLDNLLSNAVKFSAKDGQITVTLGREMRADGAWAILTVSDQGIGIPEADLSRLGDRFSRGQNVIGRIAGTGLGLASALAVARGHGGVLTLSSTENVGTTVTVELPLAHSSPESTPLGAP